VRLVVVPPAQLPGNLAAGHLDGFCAGEPWNSVAEHAGTGWCAARSADLAPGHPEKVLAVHPAFAARRGSELLAVVAALLSACRQCASPEGREAVIELLSRPRYLGVSPAILRAGFAHRCVDGRDGAATTPGDLDHAPDTARAAWVVHHLLPPHDRLRFPPALLSQVYRLDLFETARSLLDSQSRNETKLETCYD
jgi:ABC-type nitrate/sulfonate/bicarbonate transport system substrate-binding protein